MTKDRIVENEILKTKLQHCSKKLRGSSRRSTNWKRRNYQRLKRSTCKRNESHKRKQPVGEKTAGISPKNNKTANTENIEKHFCRNYFKNILEDKDHDVEEQLSEHERKSIEEFIIN